MSKRRRPPGRPPTAAVRTLDQELTNINEITHQLSRLNRDRDEAVLRARELGASWHKIGLATELTPQGANARWRLR